MAEKFKHQISPERFKSVSQEIALGSEPGFRFYALVAVSTMIASFGLINDSTAVVIGAMLVAPLMTPIFGIALALLRGDADLLGKALRAEIVGVFAAVLMGFILGSLYPALEPTPEMLSRTQPQLFDLLVAVLAGFAGSYAMVDEHISPALPGVAIATAIVPPLANTGLCFSVGAYAGGSGSFLLFFANFLSILLVASFTFWFFGMARDFERLKRKDIVKRFGLPIFGFLLVAAFLSYTLYRIAQDRILENSIESALSSELSNLPATGIGKMVYHQYNEKLYVLVNVHSPRTISPRQVKRIQENLSKKLEVPTELIVRNALAQDVSALGSSGQIFKQNLDGFFITKDVHPNVKKTRTAEKILRDYLASEIAMNLEDVVLLPIGKRLVLVATISGFSPLTGEEIGLLEERIKQKTNVRNLELVIRFVQTDLRDKEGQLQLEWSNLPDMTDKQRTVYQQGKSILKESFKNFDELFLLNLSYTIKSGTYFFFLEVAGPKIFTVENVKVLERKLNKELGVPVRINVWSRSETVASNRGYTSYEDATKDFYKSREKEFRGEIEKILRATE